MTESIRGNRSSDGFPVALAAHIREQADLAVRSVPFGQPGGRGRALEALASLVATLDLDDHRLYSLLVANQRLGGTRANFSPGPEQRKLLARAGVAAFPPADSNDVLEELVSAGVEDVAKALGEETAALKMAQAEAEQTAKSLFALQDQVKALEADRASVQADVEAAREKLAGLEAERDFLAAAVRDENAPKQARKQGEKAAREQRVLAGSKGG